LVAPETSFADWLARQIGTRNWVVAARSTTKLREKYQTIIRPHIFAAYKKQYGEEIRKFYAPMVAL
jgi:hypothetical protein